MALNSAELAKLVYDTVSNNQAAIDLPSNVNDADIREPEEFVNLRNENFNLSMASEKVS
jgi:hypothetical protein